MSKEARALLKKINDKKNAIRGLQGQGKTQEMKDRMTELREMQEEFDMLMEMEEDDDDGIKDSLHNGKVKEVEDGQKSKKYSKAQVCKAFVNRIVCGLRKRAMPEEDQEIMDSFKNMMKEGEDEDGGFTVPEDVSTDIIELRRTENDLEQYVNVEKVATMSGSRVIEVDADSTPWGDVDEGGEFEEEETPNLKQIKYAIKKKGGILKTTRELLQDTAVNILAYLNKWIAKKSRATRNAAILNVINTITKGKEVAVATFDDFKDVFNVKLDPAIAVSSIVLTNQDGFNYMDKLKDKDGKYIMQPDPTDATKTLLFGKYPVKVVSNKTLKSTNVLKGGAGAECPYFRPQHQSHLPDGGGGVLHPSDRAHSGHPAGNQRTFYRPVRCVSCRFEDRKLHVLLYLCAARGGGGVPADVPQHHPYLYGGERCRPVRAASRAPR